MNKGLQYFIYVWLPQRCLIQIKPKVTKWSILVKFWVTSDCENFGSILTGWKFMGEQRSNGSLRLCLAPVGSLSFSASEKSVGKRAQSLQLDMHEDGICS